MKNRFADTFLEENSHPPELLCTKTCIQYWKIKKQGPTMSFPARSITLYFRIVAINSDSSLTCSDDKPCVSRYCGV